MDFASLKRNGMDMEALISTQKMFGYFRMLNGPTCVNLVKDLWVRSCYLRRKTGCGKESKSERKIKERNGS